MSKPPALARRSSALARRRRGRPISGWICLDKPAGLGSTPAVARVRRLFDAQKAGHAGTLDPLATGILPIALGEATKTVAFLMDAAKSYRVGIAWGVETDTLDGDGAAVARSDARPSRAMIESALPAFVGDIEQVPPAYSAVHVHGDRAYELARRGERPALAARVVRVDALRIAEMVSTDRTILDVDCGKGTYVRSLVRDLARSLGAHAHVAALRRTRVGPFREDQAIALASLEVLCDKDECLEALLPVETALDDIPELAVTDEDAFRLSQGRAVVLLPRQVDDLRPRLSAGRTVLARTSGSRSRVVALCQMRAGRLEPDRVFHL